MSVGFLEDTWLQDSSEYLGIIRILLWRKKWGVDATNCIHDREKMENLKRVTKGPISMASAYEPNINSRMASLWVQGLKD